MSFSNPIIFSDFDNLKAFDNFAIKTFNKDTEFQLSKIKLTIFHKLLEKIMKTNHSLLKLYFEKVSEYFINCIPQYLLIFQLTFFFVNTKFESDLGNCGGKFEPERLEMIDL